LLPALAAQLVQDKVDVIVTGGTPAAQALKAATQSIPIVVAIMADPVAAGIVETLARPGGNATGFQHCRPRTGRKAAAVAEGSRSDNFLGCRAAERRNPQSQIELKELKTAAASMGLRLVRSKFPVRAA
jgi:putative ABC transport system substrate-binding protein